MARPLMRAIGSSVDNRPMEYFECKNDICGCKDIVSYQGLTVPALHVSTQLSDEQWLQMQLKCASAQLEKSKIKYHTIYNLKTTCSIASRFVLDDHFFENGPTKNH